LGFLLSEKGVLADIMRAVRIVCMHHFSEEADFQDAQQECWLRVVRNIDSLHDPSKAFEWAWTISKRTCAAIGYKLHSRHDTAALSQFIEDIWNPSVGEEGETLHVEDVVHAVRRLPPTLRHVVIAHDYLGVGLVQIAYHLDVSLRTANRISSKRRQTIRASFPAGPTSATWPNVPPCDGVAECDECVSFEREAREIKTAYALPLNS
jgi:RNA polymerase sigma factor (sigma-70 family)